MSLLDLLGGAQGGGLDGIARQLGIDPGVAQSLAAQLAPAISGGVKRRAEAEGGLGAVLGALKGEGAAGFLDRPEAAASDAGRSQGEDFLAQIFGQREAAPALARAAAERTGAREEEAHALLPALAAMLQGGLQRQAPDEEIEAGLRGLQASGGDRAGAGLGDLMGMLQGGGASGSASGGGGGGLLGGILGAITGGGKSGGGGGGDQLAGLMKMLDRDGDGSPLDDILGQIMK